MSRAGGHPVSARGLKKHPTTEKRFRDAAAKMLRWRAFHRTATDLHWRGILLTQFDDFELSLLKDYLSEADYSVLKRRRDAEGG